MAGRMSSRDRLERLRAEAEATRREKESAAEAKRNAPPSPRKAPAAKKAPPGRVRIVWVLCDWTGKALRNYPYREETEARAEAERLTAETGKSHFVKRGEVPAP